ncbi:MAG: hypothetical protein K0U19_06150 [Proteobacteria bacterium]|nr:hypothetical protein [Pseudomonadota bacterium]
MEKIASGASIECGNVIPPQDAMPAFVRIQYEISLKYLHNNWSKFEELKVSSLKKLSKVIHIIQRGGEPPEPHTNLTFQQINKKPKLKEIYKSLGKNFGDTKKIELSASSRIYITYGNKEDAESSAKKAYLVIIDPHHRIDK